MHIIKDHQIRRLHIKYNTAILSSGLNAYQHGIVDEAVKLAEQAAQYKDFKLGTFKKNPTFPKSSLKQQNKASSAKKTVVFATNLNIIFEAAAEEEQGTQEEQETNNQTYTKNVTHNLILLPVNSSIFYEFSSTIIHINRFSCELNDL